MYREIEQIISMDVTLTYSLLKIANSAYFCAPYTDDLRPAGDYDTWIKPD